MEYAIIGGGLSGALCTMELLRTAKNPITVHLFEKKTEQLFKGVAYSSSLPHQLLNVPASHMSALHDAPTHFVDWYRANHGDIDSESFISRHNYGDYLAETFESTVQKNPQHKLNVIHDEAIDIVRDIEGYKVISKNTGPVRARQIFLCTGNFPPSDVIGISDQVLKHEKYVSHPWSGFKTQAVSADEDVVMIGSGLTMVDQVLSLGKSNHRGKITTISRRGFLPHMHGHAAPYTFSYVPDFSHIDINELTHWIRNEVRNAQESGNSWIGVINAIRDHTPLIWNQLSLKSRERFLRHVRPFWEIHRHRIPVESAEKIQAMTRSGQLQIIAGRVRQTQIIGDKIQVGYKPKGKDKLDYFSTDWIINCTGPQANYRKIKSALFQNLFKSELAEVDELSMGIKTDTNGRLINANKHVFENIFVVGPPAKGVLWECTALREIRKQAVYLANRT